MPWPPSWRPRVSYLGPLLHELTHAISATIDGSLEFENALTGVLGVVAAEAVRSGADRSG